MSIAIHHGAPGSYKTSGAIQDNLIPAILAGRTVCTNIRGLDCEETIRKNLKNVPDSFKLLHVDTSSSEGRIKMAMFFHWLPADAYLLIDEINTIYPTTLTAANLAKLDYPGGIDQAANDTRPANVVEAFEMHRHYNWDICCTTPHIRKVHQIVRGSSEGAFRHKNQALVGLKGFYQEILHSADDDGKSLSNQIQMRQRRIKKNVFKLYSSTTTDSTRDTQAGRNVFLSPQVLGFIAFFCLMGIYLYTKGNPLQDKNIDIVENDISGISSPIENVDINNSFVSDNTAIDSVTDVKMIEPPAPPRTDYLSEYDVYFVGNFKVNNTNHYQLQLVKNRQYLTVDNDYLMMLGYELKAIGECLAELSIGKITRLITCPMVAGTSQPQSTAKNVSLNPF